MQAQMPLSSDVAVYRVSSANSYTGLAPIEYNLEKTMPHERAAGSCIDGRPGIAAT